MRVISLAAALLLVTSASALAQGPKAGHAMRANQLQWMPAPPMLPKGTQIAVLSGDPTKAGPFTIRLKIPAGYKVPAHSHPTAELVTVISGEFDVGMGDKLDEAKAEKLGPGGFVDLPADMNHFAFGRTAAVVQINSEGPFVINYVNSADDPRKSQ